MKVKLNDSFSHDTGRLKLDILAAGYGELERGWRGEVVNTPYSRFYFVLDGEFYVTADDGKVHTFKSGHACLIPTGVSYSFRCDNTMKHAYFHIRLYAFDKIDLLGELGAPISIPISYPYTSEELAALSLSEEETDNFKLETELRRALCDMLTATGTRLTRNKCSHEMKSIIRYIGKNLSISLNISDIARTFGFSLSTLTRRFRREIGMSIGEYIDKLIMFEAERALVSTSASILEISESLGFCDQFYFSRRFKEKYGVSPREYRKRTNI